MVETQTLSEGQDPKGTSFWDSVLSSEKWEYLRDYVRCFLAVKQLDLGMAGLGKRSLKRF